MTQQQWIYIMPHDIKLYLQKEISEVNLGEKYYCNMGLVLNSFQPMGTENAVSLKQLVDQQNIVIGKR
jgi:hypothetical protein